MTKIVDVAKEAGVSKSTVSRVLNNDKAVKENTRIAVQNVIAKLNYSPSYFAQGIRTRRTKTLALLVPEYSNFFYTDMFRGAEDVALKNKYMILVCSTLRHSITEIDYLEGLLKRNIDGIIYNTYDAKPEVLEYLGQISNKTPVVVMNKLMTDKETFAHVYTDGFESTRKAVHYLHSRGKRKIGYIRNIKNISITDDRYNGYLKGLEECGLPLNRHHVYQPSIKSDPDYVELGKDAARNIARQQERPDAVLAVIDMMAIGCINELKKHGIMVPVEINVVGFDNVSVSELIEPSLTTIAQPTRELGRTAAKIVIAQLDDKPIKSHVSFEGELIVRDSTN